MIAENDRSEFIGQIIDIFEDFLEEKGKEDSENPAIIYGTDYGDLSDNIENMMMSWGVLKTRCK